MVEGRGRRRDSLDGDNDNKRLEIAALQSSADPLPSFPTPRLVSKKDERVVPLTFRRFQSQCRNQPRRGVERKG